MKHESVIVTQLAGKQIPKQYLEYAQANRTGYIGVAIPDLKKGGVMHVAGPSFTLEDVTSTQADSSDPQVWYFARHDEGLNADDLQPFVVLRSSSNEPLICAFLTGEYELDFTHKESKHTTDFFVVQEYLIGKVAKLYTECEESLSETVKELKQPTVYKEITRTCRRSPEAKMQITMVAGDGSVWSYSTMQPASFDWGSATETFGFTEKADEKPVERKSGMFSSPAGAPAEVPLPTSVPSVPSTPATVPNEGESTGWERFKDTFFVPPDHIVRAGRHAIKNFYKHWSVEGKVPDKKDPMGNWETGTLRVKIREQMLRQVEEALASNKVKLWTVAAAEPAKPVTTIQPPVATVDKPAVLGMLLAPEKRETFSKELLSKVICTRDEKGQVIIDPNKLSEWEKNLPTVAEQMGKKNEQFVFDVDAARATIEKFPEFALRQWLMEQSQKVLLASQLSAAHAKIAELEAKNVRPGMFGKTG